jgi:ComF family protein
LKGKTHVFCADGDTPVSILSAFEYEGIVRNCIKTAKYRGKTFAPLKKLATEAVVVASKADFDPGGLIVTSIPLGRRRSRNRGFNQAAVIGRTVAREFSLLYKDNILTRKKETAAQYEKSRRDRFKNMSGAFSCYTNLSDKKILLVDDICTTGATLLSASRALYSAGADKVLCFTVAKKF